MVKKLRGKEFGGVSFDLHLDAGLIREDGWEIDVQIAMSMDDAFADKKRFWLPFFLEVLATKGEGVGKRFKSISIEMEYKEEFEGDKVIKHYVMLLYGYEQVVDHIYVKEKDVLPSIIKKLCDLVRESKDYENNPIPLAL